MAYTVQSCELVVRMLPGWDVILLGWCSSLVSRLSKETSRLMESGASYCSMWLVGACHWPKYKLQLFKCIYRNCRLVQYAKTAVEQFISSPLLLIGVIDYHIYYCSLERMKRLFGHHFEIDLRYVSLNQTDKISNVLYCGYDCHSRLRVWKNDSQFEELD